MLSRTTRQRQKQRTILLSISTRPYCQGHQQKQKQALTETEPAVRSPYIDKQGGYHSSLTQTNATKHTNEQTNKRQRQILILDNR